MLRSLIGRIAGAADDSNGAHPLPAENLRRRMLSMPVGLSQALFLLAQTKSLRQWRFHAARTAIAAAATVSDSCVLCTLDPRQTNKRNSLRVHLIHNTCSFLSFILLHMRSALQEIVMACLVIVVRVKGVEREVGSWC